MSQNVIDLRSDTVTQPDRGMREAIAGAVVGDDVWRDDPTVLQLEKRVAKMLGKDTALFFPSGTMSNACAIALHAEPGSEVLCEQNCHIFYYESGHPAALAGVQLHPVPGHNGALSPEMLKSRVRPDDIHFPPTRLVCVENTHNRCGGRVIPMTSARALYEWASKEGIAVHLDGARIWNASVATGVPVSEIARWADTVSCCLSKGLGAPAGSLLAMPKKFYKKALRLRKRMGGGMRQVGILAAAGLYALDVNFPKLVDDHINAQRLAEALADMDKAVVSPLDVETNIVNFRVLQPWSAPKLVAAMEKQGVLMGALGPDSIRAVTHIGIDADQIDEAIEVISDLLSRG